MISMKSRCFFCLIVVLSGITSIEGQPGSDYWQLRRQAIESCQKKDYRAALEQLLESDRRVPGNPDTIFRLATVHCRLGQYEAGMRQLQRLLRMRTYFDLQQEPAFAGLSKSVAFRHLLAEMENLRTAKAFQARTAFRIADPSFLPEGIAYDLKTSSLFLASMYRRKIVRFDKEGRLTNFLTAGQNGIWSISGIGVDSIRRVLWACSNRFEGSEGYVPGMEKEAALYAFDLDTAGLNRRYPIEKPGDDHFCDGLTLAPDGTVYVADSAGLTVYAGKPGERDLGVLLGPESGISPQGLALSRDGRALFVSDYMSGLYLINLKDRKISRVQEDPPDSLAGIDGLVAYGKNLIAIQNGIQPNRVVMLTMSEDGLTVRAVKVLEINHPRFGEPTLGTLVNNSLFFVANNPIEQFLSAHRATGFPEPVVLRRDLR
jgi:sugar lactone lactonase YvrE